MFVISSLQSTGCLLVVIRIFFHRFLTEGGSSVQGFIKEFEGFVPIIFFEQIRYDCLPRFLKFIVRLVKGEFPGFILDFRYNLFHLIFLIAFIHEHKADF